MNFMDQTRDSIQSQDIPRPGQMGATVRPKTRFLDKVLMKQRDQQQAKSTGAMSGGMGGMLSPEAGGLPPEAVAAFAPRFFGGTQ
jgi:hypothetical protein